MTEQARKLSRHETHDLGMIIKDRAKALKAHVEQQKAACIAEFEAQMASEYRFDQDEVWQQVTKHAMEVVADAQVRILERCKELGIPSRFSPQLQIGWQKRGENILEERRRELRRVAERTVDAMAAAAVVKIEQQSLDLRTQVVAMGLLSPDAKLFLESLAPVEEAMRMLKFEDVEKKLESQKAQQRRLGFGGCE